MARKGLDTTFVHYGIRKEDVNMIEALCTEHQLDFDWVKEEVLKSFHDRKISNKEMDEKAIEKIIEKALAKL
ncbi:DNA modification system-associated small protein [Pontibacter arcticus]|uniref:Uncharacterized protein n=1 Tax=Pontibacter arcticus TaxID=2080288 RepID=A0A364RAP7_9BACT|nr:DNA modification system-associated small protein [Pontibacter arcticus]MDX5435737.1 hypothetical protein [Pontibacter sp.]RAU81335.1 hypothetical protein DP923_16000 [Pontibacter arcticus]RAU81400.1 hypothetical protein DP923_16345 [Pontibacter arcticus]